MCQNKNNLSVSINQERPVERLPHGWSSSPDSTEGGIEGGLLGSITASPTFFKALLRAGMSACRFFLHRAVSLSSASSSSRYTAFAWVVGAVSALSTTASSAPKCWFNV